jgi:Kef-type K+ transport system membrane component KefB
MTSLGSLPESLLTTVLLQLVVILATARLFACVFRLLKQPAVVGEIAAGLALGPSLLGRFFPDVSQSVFDPSVNVVFETLSQLGLILLLFLVGLEFDFSHLRWHSKSAVSISLMGIALPFGLGLGLASVMHPHLERAAGGEPVSWLGFTLFMGIAMSITAIPVLGRIMLELNITRTRLGAITISAAAVNDACGWIILATISSIVASQFQLAQTLTMLGATLLFFALMLFVARPMLKRLIQIALRREGSELGFNSFAVLLVLLFVCAIATSVIGISAIFGAFLLGTVLSDELAFREAITRQLRNFLTVFFLPIFFTYTGLKTDLGTLTSTTQWLLLAGVLACAVLGKLGGCGVAAWLTGFSRREAFVVGAMMNTRGLMELVVINVGRELGVITDSVFCMLVLMALLTTVMTTPVLLAAMRGTELEPFIRESGFLAAKNPR